MHRDAAFVDEPFDRYGALASMGGVFSSVRDLTTWVHGFAEAFPARDDPEGSHPLSRASRREMQQVQRAFDPELGWTSAGAAPSLLAGGYGFGLFVSQDLTLGRVVDHSGGYPGFGSHMRWHPASGVGVIALGNRTYAPMSRPAAEALKALVAARSHPSARWWDGMRRTLPAPMSNGCSPGGTRTSPLGCSRSTSTSTSRSIAAGRRSRRSASATERSPVMRTNR